MLCLALGAIASNGLGPGASGGTPRFAPGAAVQEHETGTQDAASFRSLRLTKGRMGDGERIAKLTGGRRRVKTSGAAASLPHDPILCLNSLSD